MKVCRPLMGAPFSSASAQSRIPSTPLPYGVFASKKLCRLADESSINEIDGAIVVEVEGIGVVGTDNAVSPGVDDPGFGLLGQGQQSPSACGRL